MDQQDVIAIAQDQTLKVLGHYNAPPEIYPKEIGIRKGRTSVYVWDFQSSYPSEENGNIYMASKLGELDDEYTVRKVTTHENMHLLQEKMLGRDMTQRIQSEAEAESKALRIMKGDWPELGPRQTPVQDFWFIRNNPMPASTCWLGGEGEVMGIRASEGCECATFTLAPGESFRVLRLLGIIS